ncbi:HNH endonuclease [Engelhardtia mirabilis]|uniref:HNH endonuclease n=1 Tax=Engelhardtia mirabilis TaxID=2528011 RepID=A0A518BL02_9BACT|nr:HNH endonuclease [Planctomycetes bacterium Pla133]QDV01986.1 HNH endonuclease [Planctomycetes bacterium Pla86]
MKRSNPNRREAWNQRRNRKRLERHRELKRRSANRGSGFQFERELAERRAALADRRWAREEFRRLVLIRAGHRCERCSSAWELQAHHFLPKSRGGPDLPENGICLCAKCHRGVHDHTVEDWASWIDSRKAGAA